MVLAIRGHYDGKVIVPNEPVDLPHGQEFLFHVEDSVGNPNGTGVPGQSLMRFSGTVGADDLDQMTHLIAQGCEQVNLDEW